MSSPEHDLAIELAEQGYSPDEIEAILTRASSDGA